MYSSSELLPDDEAESFADGFLSSWDTDTQDAWDHDPFGPDAEVWDELDEE